MENSLSPKGQLSNVVGIFKRYLDYNYSMKKGMSDVVTTVLIILFAIIAVVIVGGIVMNQIGKTGEKIASAAICSELEVEPVRCSNDITTAYVVVQRGSGGADIKLSNVVALFEKADGTIDTAYIDDVSTFKPLSSAKLFSHSIIDNVKRVGLSVEITDDKGSKSSCNYYKTTKEDCFKGDETPSLLGYWPFDTAGNYKDYSGKGYDLAPTIANSPANSPTFNTVSGTGNGYLSFDGATTGTPPVLIDKSLTNSRFIWPASYQQVTVSFWAKVAIGTNGVSGTTDAHGNAEVFGIGIPTFVGKRFSAHFLYTEQNLLVWDYGDANLNGRYRLYYSAIPSPGNTACRGNANCLDKWTHVVLVSDGSTSKNVYINGQALTAKNSADHPNMELTGLYIGKAKFDNTGSSFPADWIFKGNLDEFMIYNQVLTNDQINRIYNIQRSKFGV